MSRYETWCLGVKRVKKFNVVLLGKWVGYLRYVEWILAISFRK